MEESSASAPSLIEIVNRTVGLGYYESVRRDVFAQGPETEALEELTGQVGDDAVKRATVFALLGKRDEAFSLLGKTSGPVPAYILGKLLLEEGRAAEALPVLEKAHAENSGLELGVLLVEARVITGDVENGRQLFASLGLPSEDGRHHYLEGLCLEKEGDYKRALIQYERASSLCLDQASYHFRWGYLLSLHGDDDEAVTAYERCLHVTPIFARAVINLGILYEDAERYEDAMSCYAMVANAHPDNYRARMYLGDAEASLDMYYDREKEKERSRRNQLLQIPITDFELSVRSRNCLQKMNIHTLGDLIKKTEAELLSYKNFGETSLNEIKRILAQKGFRLGQGLDEERSRQKALPDSEHEKMLSEPVSVLELSSRSQRCMDRLGIESIGELIKRTELELVSQKNFGVTSLNEVKRKLKTRSLSLASG